MNRREFLRTAAVLGGAAAVFGPRVPSALAARNKPRRLRGGTMLDLPASAAPIDHVVVLMMENRSFDHYLGWLGDDMEYRQTARSLHRKRLKVDGDTSRIYVTPEGDAVETYHLPSRAGETNPFRGCGHPDPGHGWNAGRAQRDGGFLAQGSGNDPYALGWFGAADLPFYTAITRRFTVFDRYFASVLGPTYPNREYLHSGQSGGIKNNAFPPEVGYPTGFTWPTIWDRLITAGVPARYYFVDLPVTALWGARLVPISSHIENYFVDAAAGTLPNVTFLDPGFTTELRTDEHPFGDVRDGQKFVFDCIKAFVESPHWERGLFILTYDEWGGFFDHVRPERFPDVRAHPNDAENFGQGGFRVPARLLSPYARRNFVDHTVYDHTSILRFLEWRFLGAPAWGPGGLTDSWFLTTRDRFANNIGYSLLPENPDPEFDVADLPEVPVSSPPCEPEGAALSTGAPRMHDFERGIATGFYEQMGYDIDLRPLPRL